MNPVPVKREDLLILWTVRELKDEKGEVVEGALQLRGRVYYKDDKPMPKPRMLAEIMIPKDIVEEQGLTMDKLIAIGEERAQLDIHEIAATGPFGRGGVRDGDEDEGIDTLRECMAR